MHTPTAPTEFRQASVRAGVSAIVLLALTAVHHAYGAYLYDTPWRLRMLYVAIPSVLLIVAALRFVESSVSPVTRRLIALVMSAAILAFPVAMVGMFEGGYNHVLKNLFFFGGGEGLAQSLFPAPAYRLPDDLLFEATGIAQFPVAIMVGHRTLSFLRKAAI